MTIQAGKNIRSLFVVDTEASWIRSFLHAMPPEVRIHGFRVRNALQFPGGLRAQLRKVGRSEAVSASWDDTWISIPGWNKAFGLSSWLVARQIKRTLRRVGQPDAILFTLPWYARVAGNCAAATRTYYAHDTFRYYGWDNNKIIPLEKQLLDSCQVGFGVARRVVTDLQEQSRTPMHYLPMATTWRPGETSAEGEAAAEQALESVPGPRVGCVGQINRTAYDWDLIEYLSASFPDAQFVFLGPRFKEPSDSAAHRLDAVFARPNVHWLGAKPHSHLPAYLRRFDVCFNPLGVTEHNHRRSPLRLFDYLTTDRPIVSTAIAEAFSHVPFVHIARDREEFHRLLGEALTWKVAPDLERRRNHIAANTWQVRAAEFCTIMEATAGAASAKPEAPAPEHRKNQQYDD